MTIFSNGLGVGIFPPGTTPGEGNGYILTEAAIDQMHSLDHLVYYRFRVPGLNHGMPAQDIVDSAGGIQPYAGSGSQRGGLTYYGISKATCALRYVAICTDGISHISTSSDHTPFMWSAYKKDVSAPDGNMCGPFAQNEILGSWRNGNDPVLFLRADGVLLDKNQSPYITGGGSTATEGDWTGAFAGDGGSITTTATASTGHYVKEGRKVTISGLFTIASVSSPTGHLVLSGLPFPGSAGSKYRTALPVVMWGMPASFNSQLMALVQGNSSIYIVKMVNGAMAPIAADVIAGTAIFVGGTYFTD